MDRQELFKLIDNFHICEADWKLYQQLFVNGPPRANTLNQLSDPFFSAIHLCLAKTRFTRIFNNFTRHSPNHYFPNQNLYLA
jgi:hypothetical protein